MGTKTKIWDASFILDFETGKFISIKKILTYEKNFNTSPSMQKTNIENQQVAVIIRNSQELNKIIHAFNEYVVSNWNYFIFFSDCS